MIRDLHTTIAAGRDVAELLVLAVLLHVQGSHAFLHDTGAPADLRGHAAMLGWQAAGNHGAPEMLGMAAFGSANGLLATGEFDLAQAVLDSVTVPTTTGQAEHLEGSRAVRRTMGLCFVLCRSARPARGGDPGCRRFAGAGVGVVSARSLGPTKSVRSSQVWLPDP